MGVTAGAKVVRVETTLADSTILRSLLLPRSTTIAKVMSDDMATPCGFRKDAKLPTPSADPEPPPAFPATSEDVTAPPVRLSIRTRWPPYSVTIAKVPSADMSREPR